MNVETLRLAQLKQKLFQLCYCCKPEVYILQQNIDTDVRGFLKMGLLYK